MWTELTEKHREIYDNPVIGGDDPGRHFDEHLSRVGTENLYVAVAGSDVVALMGLIKREDEVEIEPMVVSREYRDKGIGRMLIDIAFEEARKLGVTFLSVRPVARNVEAMRFFSDRGFRNIGHVELFVDLSGRDWRSRLNLHGVSYDY